LVAIGDVLWPDALKMQWQLLADSVVKPKLLVMYETVSPQFQHQADQSKQPLSAVAVALWHRLNEARRARAMRPGVGPVLWLESVEPAEAEKQLTAAIQAMR
jgi:hypothetical protein